MHPTQNGLFADFVPAPAPAVSKKGFAEMIGVTPGRVSQLIEAGLPVQPNGTIAVKEGVAWVEANTDPARRRAILPGSTASAPAGSSRARRDAADAVTAELKAAKLAGNLIDRRVALRVVESRARMERDSWIAWVNRVGPGIAAATGGDIAVIAGELDRLVREHLASLAEIKIERLEA
ncbi:hypothetical protein OCUBac02_02220 [Bosea sp. ANAM02]|nr:hypothetical protein OCUBac02_02220 [Bosea sp. ANAM02]